MNVITFTGNLGRDPELRYTPNGTELLTFSVGSSVGFGDHKQTIWFDCAVWGARAPKLEPILTSGMKVTVIGELSLREVDSGKTYLKVRVGEIDFHGKPRPEKMADPRDTGFRERKPETEPAFEDDEIPF